MLIMHSERGWLKASFISCHSEYMQSTYEEVNWSRVYLISWRSVIFWLAVPRWCGRVYTLKGLLLSNTMFTSKKLPTHATQSVLYRDSLVQIAYNLFWPVSGLHWLIQLVLFCHWVPASKCRKLIEIAATKYVVKDLMREWYHLPRTPNNKILPPRLNSPNTLVTNSINPAPHMLNAALYQMKKSTNRTNKVPRTLCWYGSVNTQLE